MKNKKAISLAALIGLAFGSVAVATTASAQVDDANPYGSNSIVLVQEADGEQSDAEDGNRGRRGHRRGRSLSTVADVIGVETADLRAALQSGDSIADVATANGVSVDAVISALVDAKTERLADKVSEGRLTQAEADDKLAELESRIADKVNGVERTEQA